MAEEGAPRVTVSEAIGILRLKKGRTAASKPGGQPEKSIDEQEVEEARERILTKLRKLGERQRREQLAAGWQEWRGELVPPGLPLPPPDSEAG